MLDLCSRARFPFYLAALLLNLLEAGVDFSRAAASLLVVGGAAGPMR